MLGTDALIAAGWTLLTLAFLPAGSLGEIPIPVWLSLTGLMGLALAFRRTAPAATVVALGLLMVVHVLLIDTVTGTAVVATLSAGYTTYSFLDARWRRWATAVMLVGTAWAAVSYSRAVFDREWYERWPLVLVQWLLVGFFCLLGSLARHRREEHEALAERARLLERDQAREIELATLAERTHIARELHDIVAHSLGVIVAQADGGRYAAAGDPEAARKALTTLADVARGSLGEMRSLVTVLRSPEPRGAAPAPGVAELSALYADYRRAGLDLRLRETGQPVAMSPARELAVHRLIQEALANTLRHAGRVRARVELDWEPGTLTISVANPITEPGERPAGPDGAPASGGNGLVGMRERLALHGGTVQAGPHGGTWLVRATLPTGETPVQPHETREGT